MIESIMYFGIGFLVACLSVLIVVPLVHSRAVRLTTRRLVATVPSSTTEILTGKDLQRAEFALSTRKLETKLEQLRDKNATQLAEFGRKADAINKLLIELDALRDKLRISEEKSEGAAVKAREAERALTGNESKLTALTSALEQRSSLADSQKADIAALMLRVQSLQEEFAAADNKTRTAEQQRDAERMHLEATNDKLVEERAKFEDFHHRVTELVRRVIANTRNDELLSRRTQDYLRKHLIEQSRLLKESEREYADLRREMETARTAESEILASEIEHRVNAVAEKLKLENARLQSALDRANGERTRLSYELAKIKRQATDSQAA